MVHLPVARSCFTTGSTFTSSPCRWSKDIYSRYSIRADQSTGDMPCTKLGGKKTSALVNRSLIGSGSWGIIPRSTGTARPSISRPSAERKSLWRLPLQIVPPPSSLDPESPPLPIILVRYHMCNYGLVKRLSWWRFTSWKFVWPTFSMHTTLQIAFNDP